jgi:hypothetical protein
MPILKAENIETAFVDSRLHKSYYKNEEWPFLDEHFAVQVSSALQNLGQFTGEVKGMLKQKGASELRDEQLPRRQTIDFYKTETNKISYTINSKHFVHYCLEYHKTIRKHNLRFIFVSTVKKADNAYRSTLAANAELSLEGYQDSIAHEIRQNAKNQFYILGKSFRKHAFNYLAPFEVLKQIAPLQDSNSIYMQQYAELTYLSFITNRYKETLEGKRKVSGQKNKPLQDTISFEGYHARNALEAIAEKSRGRRLVMMNEDHLNPYSRVFARRGLSVLKSQGFELLGMETLAYKDSTINSRGYPVQQSGVYTSEPNFSNFVREALNLGFVVFPYEADAPPDSIVDRRAQMQYRENMQATNIAKAVEENEGAKILIYAGHGHIYKSNPKSSLKFMAEVFNELTGIEPLCIEQTMMTELDSTLYESPYYISAQKEFGGNNSMVLEKDGTLWVHPSYQKSYDIQVFHPRTSYLANEIPTWGVDFGKHKKRFTFSGDKYKQAIFQLFVHNEREGEAIDQTAVPLLNIILQKENDFEVYLKENSYISVVYDTWGKNLF